MNPVLKDEDFDDEEAFLLDEEELQTFVEDVRQASFELEAEGEKPVEEGIAEEDLEKQEALVEDVDVVDEPAQGAALKARTEDNQLDEALEDIDMRLGMPGASLSYPNNHTPSQIEGVLENPIFQDAVKAQIREEMPPIDDQWQRDRQVLDIENLVRNTYRTEHDTLSTDSPALRSVEGM